MDIVPPGTAVVICADAVFNGQLAVVVSYDSAALKYLVQLPDRTANVKRMHFVVVEGGEARGDEPPKDKEATETPTKRADTTPPKHRGAVSSSSPAADDEADDGVNPAKVADFMEFTDTLERVAKHYVSLAKGDVERAVEIYFDQPPLLTDCGFGRQSIALPASARPSPPPRSDLLSPSSRLPSKVAPVDKTPAITPSFENLSLERTKQNREIRPSLTRKPLTVADVGKTESSFLEKVQSFNGVKGKLNGVAKKSGLEGMDAFPSFGPKVLNQNEKDLGDIFRVAEKVKPFFDASVRKLVIEAGIDPDFEYTFSSGHGDDKKVYKSHSAAPLKERKRCLEKVSNEYGGDCSCLVDVVRCTAVTRTAGELARLTTLLLQGVPGVLEVLRLKNRFATGCEMATGYRDINFSVRSTSPDGTSQICEIQVHFAPILALKGEQHVLYEYFREYFKGNSESYETRMKLRAQGAEPERKRAR